MKTAWYTFGNHFHWVDMQWTWGNGVLGKSITDMLTFIDATGSPGNINFDGIGYEKLAAEEPEALASLKQAVADERIEVVGASYGQPYALFHHGESAIRQLSYGVRSVVRLLGTRPRSFWEEEFYFFPQLPQILVDAGYRYASLFFQWTWHTPHIPVEREAALLWTGLDGSHILALPRTELNLHQWPEDIEQLIAGGALNTRHTPVVQQWLELLPSPEWMCRSELVVPGVRRLLGEAGLSFKTGTLSTVLEAIKGEAVTRSYGMDDVFHGMSLGKNGDRMHRVSRELEQTLMGAESLAIVAATFGRPFAQWGAYPFWELEEAWRELLAFQHHDNDECEGLCGHIGYAGADRGLDIARHILDRNARRIADGIGGKAGRTVAVNPLGWARTAVVNGKQFDIPALGAVTISDDAPVVAHVEVGQNEKLVALRRGEFLVEIDVATGLVSQLGDVNCGEAGLGSLRWQRDGVEETFDLAALDVNQDGSVSVSRTTDSGTQVTVSYRIADDCDALDVHFAGDLGAGPDRLAHSALMTLVEPDIEVHKLFHDTPYAVTAIEGRNSHVRKYPSGDWMTSPQVFETVNNTFTGLQLVDQVSADGAGLLWIHDGSQGFHRASTGFWNVLSMRDPWDENYYLSELNARMRAVPHGPVDHAWRWRAAQEFTRPAVLVTSDRTAEGTTRFDPVVSLRDPQGVVITALYRDSDYMATGFEHVNRVAQTPLLARLVEMNGAAATVTLDVGPSVRRAWRTNALGEVTRELSPIANHINLDLRPYEIATVAIDLVSDPGDERNLDEHRQTWATIHREAKDPK